MSNDIVKYTSLAMVRKYTGEIQAGVLGNSTVVYFRISKRELMAQIQDNPDFFDIFELSYHPEHDCLYVDNAEPKS